MKVKAKINQNVLPSYLIRRSHVKDAEKAVLESARFLTDTFLREKVG